MGIKCIKAKSGRFISVLVVTLTMQTCFYLRRGPLGVDRIEALKARSKGGNWALVPGDLEHILERLGAAEALVKRTGSALEIAKKWAMPGMGSETHFRNDMEIVYSAASACETFSYDYFKGGGDEK